MVQHLQKNSTWIKVSGGYHNPILSQHLTMYTICAITFDNTTSKIFWIMGTQMVVPEITLAALKEEGIDKPKNVFEFSKEYLY